MTIKGLQKLIGKDAYNLTLINCYGGGDMIVRQHLSVWGRAIYPMDGLPVMDEETLLAVLDVPRKKWKDCQVLTTDADSTILTAMMEDNLGSDRPLEEMGIQLITGGGEYKFLLEPLRGECVAIRPEYLKPIGLTSEHTYWLRETGWDNKTGEAKHVIIIKPETSPDCCLIWVEGSRRPPAVRWNPDADDLTSDAWEVTGDWYEP